MSEAFFAMDRTETIQFLNKVVEEMGDITLKAAVHTLVSSYRPSLLKSLARPPEIPRNEVVSSEVEEEPEMRTATDENIRRLMKKERISWHAAWMQLRCKELEDGASICCTEECSDRSSAEDDLVEAARRGKEKRKARSGQALSEDEEVAEKEEPEMRTVTDENIKRLMKKEGLDWEEAWKELRCKELEDGASICCTEECSDRDEADEDLVEAARRGKEEREARAGRHVSYEDKATEGEDSVVKAPYVAPPKVRDAEFNWPFMRCKNVANAYKKSMGSFCLNDKIPRNHHGLLEYIASKKKISVETLKKTNPHELFKDNFYVINALGKSYRW